MRIATWNLLDLFVPVVRFQKAFDKKLDVLAREIVQAKPDVLALQEVTPEGLNQLVETLNTLGFVSNRVVGAVDERGIGNAILTRQNLVEGVVHQATELSFPRFVEGDPEPFAQRLPLRRAIVQARVLTPRGELSVFCLHFKSPRPMPLIDAQGREKPIVTARERAEARLRTNTFRAAEALFVRGLLDRQVGDFVVCGDFNDVEASEVLSIVRGDDLHSGLASIPPSLRWSVRFGETMLLDHILLSRGLVEEGAKIIDRALVTGEMPVKGQPMQERPPKPGSDHALVLVDVAQRTSTASDVAGEGRVS